MTIAHVGDSRAYLIYGPERIEALTRDHSLVKRLVELGQITTAEAAVHPQRNVLYRALGQGEPFDPDIYSMQVFEAAYLLLCSDGLWGVVAESEIQRLVLQAYCVEDACQRLVDAANEAGGPDNISVILARLPG
jgi:protein phosphatase